MKYEKAKQMINDLRDEVDMAFNSVGIPKKYNTWSPQGYCFTSREIIGVDVKELIRQIKLLTDYLGVEEVCTPSTNKLVKKSKIT